MFNTIKVNNTDTNYTHSIFDISEYNSGATYNNLSAALAAIPESKWHGGMTVKFIQTISQAQYSVVKTENLETEPTGTLLSEAPYIDSGTYDESQLSTIFSTLPSDTGAGNALTYYVAVTVDETTTYTSWVITKILNSDNKYIQARCMAQNFTTDVTQWQGVDDEPIAGSKNLVRSGNLYVHFDTQSSQVDSHYADKYTFQGQEVSYGGFTLCYLDVSNLKSVKLTTTLNGQNMSIWEGFANGQFVRMSTTRATTTVETYTEVVDTSDLDLLKINIKSSAGLPLIYKPINDIEKLKVDVANIFNGVDMVDAASSELQPSQIILTLRKNYGSVQNPDWRNIAQLVLPSATTQKAGLLNSEDKQKLNDLGNADDTPILNSQKFIKSGGVYNDNYSFSDKEEEASLRKIGYFSHNGSDVRNVDYRYLVFDVTNIDFIKVQTYLKGQAMHIWEGFNGDTYVRSSSITAAPSEAEDYVDEVDVRDLTIIKINVWKEIKSPRAFISLKNSDINKEKITAEEILMESLTDNHPSNDTVNILNPLAEDEELGYWSTEDGSKVSNPLYHRTKELQVIDYQKTGKVSLRQNGTPDLIWISFFDKDGVYISMATTTSAVINNISIPVNSKYYTFSTSKKKLSDICVSYAPLESFVEYDNVFSVADGKESENTKKNIEVVNGVSKVMPSGWNILPPDEIPGYWDNENNGAYVFSNVHKCTPDYIPVNLKGHMVYKNGYSIDGYLLICVLFFDKDKNFIVARSTTASVANFEVPSGIKFMKVWISPYNGQGSQGATIHNISMSYISLSYYHYRGYDFYNGKQIIMPYGMYSSLYGKTIVNFGDSIFDYGRDAHYDISSYLEELIGAKVINCGFGGTRMSGNVQSIGNYGAFSMNCLADAIDSNDWTIQETAVTHITDFADHLEEMKAINWDKVDIITIAYGTNDFTANGQLENNTDTDINYYADALRYSLKKIWHRFQNIRIFLLTPTFRCWENGTISSNTRENANGDKLTDFVNKMKEVGAEYNIDVIDNYNIGINLLNVGVYIPVADGTHHAVMGKKLIAAHIANKLY